MALEWLNSLNMQRAAENSARIARQMEADSASKDRQIKEVVDKYNELIDDYADHTGNLQAQRDFYKELVEENIDHFAPHTKEELAAEALKIGRKVGAEERQASMERLRLQKQGR